MSKTGFILLASIALLFCGCSQLNFTETAAFDPKNPDLPIEVGDIVEIYKMDQSVVRMEVIEISNNKISGNVHFIDREKVPAQVLDILRSNIDTIIKFEEKTKRYVSDSTVEMVLSPVTIISYILAAIAGLILMGGGL